MRLAKRPCRHERGDRQPEQEPASKHTHHSTFGDRAEPSLTVACPAGYDWRSSHNLPYGCHACVTDPVSARRTNFQQEVFPHGNHDTSRLCALFCGSTTCGVRKGENLCGPSVGAPASSPPHMLAACEEDHVARPRPDRELRGGQGSARKA